MIKIENIFWKRTYLFIEYSTQDQDNTISIINKNKNIKHTLNTKKLDNNLYRAKINITIAEGRELLKEGIWEIVDKDEIPVAINSNIAFNIEDYSRVFRYGGNFYAYIATFNISQNEAEDKENYSIHLHISYMKKNKHFHSKGLLQAFDEANSIKTLIKKSMMVIFKFSLNLYYQIITHITPKNGKRILFMSENMDHIRDNLEAINKRLYERELNKKFIISYSFRNIFDKKHQNPIEWLKVINKIAKQDYIFVDDYVPIFSFLKLNKKTTLIQTWHAGFGFKLVGFGRFGIKGSPNPFYSCHRKYTYGIVGNDYLREIYSEVWGIEEKSLLSTGMPRLEHFLDEDYINEFKKQFYKEHPDFKEKNIITFAPTYRGLSQRTAYYDFDKIDFDALYTFCKNNNYIVLFKMHHFIKDKVPIKDEHKDLFIELSDYKLNDLFYVTDILITDYSSCFYDFLLLNKPVLFYVYDKAEYSATRGVHRPIDKVAPGKICNNFNELINALENKEYKNKEISNMLIDKCINNKELASDKIIDYVLLKKKVDDICIK